MPLWKSITNIWSSNTWSSISDIFDGWLMKGVILLITGFFIYIGIKYIGGGHTGSSHLEATEKYYRQAGKLQKKRVRYLGILRSPVRRFRKRIMKTVVDTNNAYILNRNKLALLQKLGEWSNQLGQTSDPAGWSTAWASIEDILDSVSEMVNRQRHNFKKWKKSQRLLNRYAAKMISADKKEMHATSALERVEDKIGTRQSKSEERLLAKAVSIFRKEARVLREEMKEQKSLLRKLGEYHSVLNQQKRKLRQLEWSGGKLVNWHRKLSEAESRHESNAKAYQKVNAYASEFMNAAAHLLSLTEQEADLLRRIRTEEKMEAIYASKAARVLYGEEGNEGSTEAAPAMAA